MRSLMLQRAAPYAILCRLHGCFFIHNFRGNSLRNAKVNWKTPYTIYSLSFFGLYLILEEMYATRFAYIIRNISDTLSKYLLLVIYGVVMVKIIANLAVMLAKPDKLLAFFLKSEVFETNTGFSPRIYSVQHSTFHRWNAVRAIWVFMAFVLFFTEAERFMIAELTRSMPPQKSVPLTIFGFIMGSGFMVYDSLSYLFLRCCMKVLVEYIQVEVQGFQEAGKLQNIPIHSQSPREIEATRLRMNNIRKLKESFNEIWEGPLILACASTIMVNCVVLDAMFHDGMRKELWLAVAYSLYSSLCFIDLAYTGQSLIDEVHKFKSAILMVPAFEAPDCYLQQLRYLHEVVDPEGMCLGGGGFFVLKRSLLVPMTGSIIIFGVILVQTSNTLALKNNAT